ncbi:hypothetical protein MNBD_IGNAVI01-2808 [hydrothermal vent metagenome]|uniref:OmpA-like domain-containing protein n=2 Tax=hydrothermal vent metagenome TaxID=652676 RepID=A0A3B1DIE1_9ZZZZ
MKNKFYFSLTALLLFLLTNTAFAQLNDYSYKVGLQVAYVNPQTYFDNDGISLLFRPFGRFELGHLFDLEAGIGYGWLGMKDLSGNPVKTIIVPFDARVLFSPIVNDTWNPYLYAGFGAFYWETVDRPINPPPTTNIKDNTDIFTPVGAGVEFALSENLVLDLQAGWNYSWTELITGYNDPQKNSDNDIVVNDSWWTFGVGLAYSKESCSKDSDEDGITDCDEEKLGLDPMNPDTDGDGLKDGDEMHKYNTDPKNPDSDGDGLKDGEEVMTYFTDPLNADTDNDGLDDFAEVITYKSDPNKVDTDSDSLTDGDEVHKYKTDPTLADTDGDQIDDAVELNETKTDPTKADTDSDGLRDDQEIYTFKTDPNNPDTDGDKLSDGDEVIKYHTDPLKVDTDDGGVDDFLEIELGKDPLDPSDDVASLDLEIDFGFNSSVLSEDAVMKLYKILPKAKDILKLTDAIIEIQGHSDNVGSDKANQKISEERAKAVYDWFIANRVDQNRLRYKGYGKTRPKYSNATKEGRDKNRRIEFFVERVSK